MIRWVALMAFSLALGSAAFAQSLVEEELRLNKGEEFDMDLSLGYSVLTDMAETESQKIYYNSLSFDFDASYNHWVGHLSTSVDYKAVDGEVQADRNDVDFYFQDVEVGLSKTVWKDSRNSLTPSVSFLAPLSQSSRNLGIKGVFEGAVFYVSRFYDQRLTLSNQLSGFGIINTYYYSPVDEEVSQNAGYSYSLRASIRIGKGWSFGLGGGTRLSQYVDNTTTFRFSNSALLRYSHGDYSISGFWKNGSYIDQTNLDLWYVDQYRQIVGVSLNVVL